MNGIKIVNTGSFWVARVNSHWTVTAPTAHRVVEMLRNISETEELEFTS